MNRRSSGAGRANIDLYEKMVETSARMLEAARDGDWDRLLALQGQCRNVVDALEPGVPASAAPEAPLPRLLRERKVDLIKRLLAHDAAIRSHTEPWRSAVDQFLGGAPSPA